MTDVSTTAELEIDVGTQLRSLRLRQELSQMQLADRAGVALNAVKNLEGGKGATLGSFIRVLRALGRTDWLKTLGPSVSISPLQMLKTQQPRQRASRRGRRNV